jgi:sugar O-acyltransferase (sialic acid O-acetyltransferase NeuD family)
MKVLVIGAGGHAKVVISALRLMGKEIIGALDANAALHGTNIQGVSVLGGDEMLEKYPEALLANGVGMIRPGGARAAIFGKFSEQGRKFITLIHPSAIIASDASFEEGAQIMAGAIIQPGVSIGTNSIVNTGAVIDHDCQIAAHCHIGPRVVLSGGVDIWGNSHVGTGATIIEGINIGKGALVAAGAVVVSDVADNTRVRGVPAKPF